MRSHNRTLHASIEALECRKLLAAQPFSISEVAIPDGTQLRIVGTDIGERIDVSQSGLALTISSGGWSQIFNSSFKSLYIDGAGGNDTITLDPSVMIDAILKGGAGNDSLSGGSGHDRLYGGAGTNMLYGANGDDILVSIGGANNDKLIGGLGTDSYWLDADSTETVTDISVEEAAAGNVHRVSEFSNTKEAEVTLKKVKTVKQVLNKNGKLKKKKVVEFVETTRVLPATKELLGQQLIDPTLTKSATGYANFADRLLFPDGGPRLTDIQQGQIGSCYFLAVLSSIAKVNPNVLKQTIVDLGDGTYAVEFTKGTSIAHVRVDADLPVTAGGGLAYVNFGAQGSLWVALIEKAWASFRSNAASYASIDGGWMDESYRALGMASESYMTGTAAQVLGHMALSLAAGKSVTFAVGTPPSGSNLVGFHAYTVDRVNLGSDGKPTSVRLRNPWGVDGYASVDGLDDAYVTVTGDMVVKAMLGYTIGVV